jgi:hypothetical protein
MPTGFREEDRMMAFPIVRPRWPYVCHRGDNPFNNRLRR